MKTLVIGLGTSGRSAASFLLQEGKKVIGVDQMLSSLLAQEEIQELQKRGLVCFDDSREETLKDCSLVVLSPGISWSHPLVQKAQEKKIEIIGEMELGARSCRHRAIGITGTNGKTTVALLCTHVLEKSGKKAKALGNVGEGFAAYLAKPENPEEIFVVEISSFQLETLKTPFLEGAVILNITPDHLDRYNSFYDYARVKGKIGHCLKKGAFLYVHDDVFHHFPDLIDSFSSKSFSQLILEMKKKESPQFLHTFLSQKGDHDRQNFLAAYSLCRNLGVGGEDFVKAFFSFQKPKHRIEFVTKIENVAFYDDSKATNIDAVIQAVKTLDGPIYLIAGGVNKGFPYSSWKKHFYKKVRKVFAIGESAFKIQKDLQKGHTEVVSSLQEATYKAYEEAKEKGGVVLLSPGCSSYDQFKNYKDRGEKFQDFVRKIEESAKEEQEQ